MKWKYIFTRYMTELGGMYFAFETGVNVEIEDPDGGIYRFSTGSTGGHSLLEGGKNEVVGLFCNCVPGVVAQQIADGLEEYCKKSAEDLGDYVGVVNNEKVGYFGEQPLGVEV